MYIERMQNRKKSCKNLKKTIALLVILLYNQLYSDKRMTIIGEKFVKLTSLRTLYAERTTEWSVPVSRWRQRILTVRFMIMS